VIRIGPVRYSAEVKGARGMSVCGRSYRDAVMAMCADTYWVSGVHAGCISLSSPVAPSRLGDRLFNGFAGLFATGDDWTRHWFFPDKEEVPGSSPGSPTKTKVKSLQSSRISSGDRGERRQRPAKQQPWGWP
jgi:hypothetical protein